MDHITHFTPYRGLIGGCLIGISTILFLWLNGRISGISGLVHGLCPPQRDSFSWRLAYIAGLVVGGLVFYIFTDIQFPLRTHFPVFLLVLAGLLVGFGTRMSHGCTSGHGVCGLARLSLRSFIATLVFFTSAIITVFIMRHILRIY